MSRQGAKSPRTPFFELPPALRQRNNPGGPLVFFTPWRLGVRKGKPCANWMFLTPGRELATLVWSAISLSSAPICKRLTLVAVDMEITHQEVAPGTVVITLAGKLMLGQEGDQIVTLVERRLAAGDRKLIFELSGVTTIDSTGIGRFIAAFNKIMAAGGEMRMAGATGHVMQSFRVSLLDKVFSFYPSLSQAL